MAKKNITQLDLFSGIGGFHLGFEKAGFKVKSYFSEVDKHAVAVYKHQFKDAEYVGSVTDVRGEQLPKIDLITFGSPCQDFSLAGKRRGMEGARSSLILEAIRLINECRPSVFIWENVKGTFSSNNGADFWAIIQAFTNIGGYRLEWQLLNTSWVLPQNRERIYLVGYSAKPGRNWRGVFPIGESSRAYNDSPGGKNQTAHTLTKQYFSSTSQGTYIGERNEVPQVATDIRGNEQIATIRTSGRGSLTAKHSWDIVKVKSATKQGYEVAEEGDGINLTGRPIRGRVGKKRCQTLDTSCQHGVLQPNYRIRRLTPIECERLQGFPDNHTAYGIYDGEVKKVSNTQRYKQCGNAVTVDIVALVAEAVKPLFK